jgi:hypothetical protein
MASDFPRLPQASLSRDDVVNYLVEQRQRGYQVFQDSQHDHVLVLILTDTHRIKFVIGPGTCQIQGEKFGQLFELADVSTAIELRNAADGLAHRVLGVAWAGSPKTARVAQDTPASNLASISGLIGRSAVQGIFDPYLENKSLAALIDILSFGKGSVANGVRVLSTNKTTSGQVPRLSKSGFEAWLAQLKITGELRLMSSSEHRRFILLSGGQSLLLGQSLNSIHKNEAIRIEPDSQDRAFFDQVWAQAKPLV